MERADYSNLQRIGIGADSHHMLAGAAGDHKNTYTEEMVN
jgi:hypothetical protein